MSSKPGGKATAAESATAVIARLGQKVAGAKGVKAASAVTETLLGHTVEPCSDKCGHCKVPCVNGTCNH